MDSQQIHSILSRDPHTLAIYKGVFASNQIPVLYEKSILIVNVDDSSSPGSHWLTFHIENKDKIQLFDSYGQSPEFYGGNILKYTSMFPIVEWNTVMLQSPTSNVCGAYCIYFAIKRSQGNSMQTIISYLQHCKKNDFRVYQFVKKRYGVKMIFKK